MRFRESLNGLLRHFYALRYGNEAAEKIVQRHGKDRAKYLAMLDEYGSKADAVIRVREYYKLSDSRSAAHTERLRLEQQLSALELRAASFLIELNASATEAERERHRASINLNAQHIEECRKALIEAQMTEDAATKELESQEPVEEEPFQIERAAPPRTLPLNEAHILGVTKEISKKTRDAIARFYKDVFGKNHFQDILLLDRQQRLQAVKEMDLQQFGKSRERLQTNLFIAREAAVKVITSKNMMSSMVDYVRAIVDDIPPEERDPDLQQKAEHGRRILDQVVPALDEANQSVEEVKDAIKALEDRVRKECQPATSE